MSNDELVLDGKTYVSSKRAAQLSQYAQDYIGQLCRAGTADCRRINGLWYVTMTSLETHKITSAEIKAKAFENINADATRNNYNDSVLSFSGEEYVSSRHGAELTGYNPDYVTQLARDGKIRGRQIGSRWYVAKKDLLTNKEKNDQLLVAVQAESVGVMRRDEKTKEQSISRSNVSELVYREEKEKPLIPNLSEKPVIESPYIVIATPVSIRADESTPRSLVAPKRMHYNASSGALLREDVRNKHKMRLKISVKKATTIAVVFVLIVGFGGFGGLKKVSLFVSRNPSSGFAATETTGISRKFTNFLIRMATDVVTYQRLK